MNPNIQEIRGTDSWNFETLKYNISNESNYILLDNAYDPGLNFFSKNVKNLLVALKAKFWYSEDVNKNPI